MASGSGPQTSSKPATGDRRRSPRRKEQARQLLAGGALVLVVVFALVNLDKVKVDWIVTTTHTALIVVIAISFALGAVAGALFWRRRAGR
jgi:uncharacterized integral membrane protein